MSREKGEGWLRRALGWPSKFLFGDDIFISYSRADYALYTDDYVEPAFSPDGRSVLLMHLDSGRLVGVEEWDISGDRPKHSFQYAFGLRQATRRACRSKTPTTPMTVNTSSAFRSGRTGRRGCWS